jgi:esterase/lipase
MKTNCVLPYVGKAHFFAAVEDGWNLLKDLSDHMFIMGQSLRGVLTMVAGSRYAFDGVIGISTPYSLLQGWQARLLHPGLLRFASLFLPEINKPALSDNPDEVDERVPKIDPDPYPRYVTRALTEVLELIEVMHDGLPQITAQLLLIHGQRYSSRVTRGPMPAHSTRSRTTSSRSAIATPIALKSWNDSNPAYANS